jgi:hypothetical protein
MGRRRSHRRHRLVVVATHAGSARRSGRRVLLLPAAAARARGRGTVAEPGAGRLQRHPFATGALAATRGFQRRCARASREDYSRGREADLSPTDLALGWGRMRDDAVLSQLSIDQANRWYHYRWRGTPPIPVREIVRSSANMHMIPADENAARALSKVRAGDNVRIDGWLVEADAPDGWHWRSSLTREDSGSGACEVVYVCSIARE